MKGNENIKIGDELLCISNEGLYSIGQTKTIFGLTETSINFNGCKTSWINRNDVRWGCYKHFPKNITEEELQKYKEYFKPKYDIEKLDLDQKTRELANLNWKVKKILEDCGEIPKHLLYTYNF